jgi:hypothetical protein
MSFHPYEPFDQNSAQRIVWELVRSVFANDSVVAYYRYPIFSRAGKLLREPDILIVHRELGILVIECKGCRIENIQSVQGHEWKMANWHSEIETPVAQAEDQSFVLKNKLDERRETRNLMTFHFYVALPFVSRSEWQSKGLNTPATQGVVLCREDLTHASIRSGIAERVRERPQRSISDEQWRSIKSVFGGTLPDQEPRNIPTQTPSTNPIRVIHAIESMLKTLDTQQQK